MNHARYLILIFLVLNCPSPGFAAQVGNIGDEALWNIGALQHSGDLSVVASLTIDNQTSDLPVQVTRFNWINPNVTPAEERAYSQTRWSRYTLSTAGLSIGIPIRDKAVVYGLIGSCNTTTDLHFEDWTVSRSFSRNDSFSSGPDIYYGIGAAIVMERIDIIKNLPLTVGMDIKYRHFNNDDNELSVSKISYSSELDEFQLAVCISAKLDLFSPYLGIRIASLTGHETYTDQNDASRYYPEGYVHYQNSITWSRDMGYVAGVSKYFNDMFSAGLEVRFGDDQGFGINATARF